MVLKQIQTQSFGLFFVEETNWSAVGVVCVGNLRNPFKKKKAVPYLFIIFYHLD